MKHNTKKKPARKPVNFLPFVLCALLVSLGFNIYLFSNKETPKKESSYPQFLEGNEKVSCENSEIEKEGLPFCPKSEKQSILPRYYPLHSIYLGYERGMEQTGLFQSALRAAMATTPKTPLVVMVPREQIQDARAEIDPYVSAVNKSYVRFVMTPSKYTVWAQDYFEMLHDSAGNMSFLDLPYDTQLGEHIPTALSLACNSNLVGQADSDHTENLNLSGNYGGNIEALTDKIVLIGNSMSPSLKTQLAEILSQDLVELDVNWLSVGHVDELISILPVKDKNRSCPFDVLYASPKKAMDLLAAEAKKQNDAQPLFLRYGFSQNEQKFNLWQCLANEKSSLGCEVLLGSNRSYEKKISKNIDLIKQQLKKTHPECNQIKFLGIPVLFTASKELKKYGTSQDLAVTIDPNPVNNVLIGDELFLPKQAMPVFHEYTKQILKPYGIKTNFVDGDYVHHFGGGIHCSMNMRRACRRDSF